MLNILIRQINLNKGSMYKLILCCTNKLAYYA